MRRGFTCTDRPRSRPCATATRTTSRWASPVAPAATPRRPFGLSTGAGSGVAAAIDPQASLRACLRPTARSHPGRGLPARRGGAPPPRNDSPGRRDHTSTDTQRWLTRRAAGDAVPDLPTRAARSRRAAHRAKPRCIMIDTPTPRRAGEHRRGPTRDRTPPPRRVSPARVRLRPDPVPGPAGHRVGLPDLQRPQPRGTPGRTGDPGRTAQARTGERLDRMTLQGHAPRRTTGHLAD